MIYQREILRVCIGVSNDEIEDERINKPRKRGKSKTSVSKKAKAPNCRGASVGLVLPLGRNAHCLAEILLKDAADNFRRKNVLEKRTRGKDTESLLPKWKRLRHWQRPVSPKAIRNVAKRKNIEFKIPREESRICSVQIDFKPFCHADASSFVRMSTVMPRTDKTRINLSKRTEGLPSSTSRRKRIPTLAT